MSVVLSACAQNLPDSVTSSAKKTSATNASSAPGNVVPVDPGLGNAATGGGTNNVTSNLPVILDKTGAIVMTGSSYFLRNVGSLSCLDVTGAATDDGTLIQPYSCGAGVTNQIWRVTLNSDASVTFTSADSGLCLDYGLDNLTGADGTIQIWDCASTPNQSFKLTASSGGYRLSPTDSLSQGITERSGQILGEAITNGPDQAYVLVPASSANPQN